jgi:hypothetical protein
MRAVWMFRFPHQRFGSGTGFQLNGRQAFASFLTTAFQDGATVGRLHAFAEATLAGTFQFGRIICTFHGSNSSIGFQKQVKLSINLLLSNTKQNATGIAGRLVILVSTFYTAKKPPADFDLSWKAGGNMPNESGGCKPVYQ